MNFIEIVCEKNTLPGAFHSVIRIKAAKVCTLDIETKGETVGEY